MRDALDHIVGACFGERYADARFMQFS